MGVRVALLASAAVAVAVLAYRHHQDSAYAATLRCENNHLRGLKVLLPRQAASPATTGVCTGGDYQCRDIPGGIWIEALSPCPESARPFCGFVATYTDGTLGKVSSGYPCL